LNKEKTSLIRRLRSKSSELKDELNFIKKIYFIAVEGFCKEVSCFCDHKKIDNPLLSMSKDEEKRDKENLTKDLKYLFREIAKKTHLDTCKTDDNRSTLEEAVEAKKNNQACDILSIAHELDIDTTSLSYKSLDAIESSIQKSEEEIMQITNSYPWKWHHATNSRKVNIVEEFVLSKV
jgi:hypothetical protein